MWCSLNSGGNAAAGRQRGGCRAEGTLDSATPGSEGFQPLWLKVVDFFSSATWGNRRGVIHCEQPPPEQQVQNCLEVARIILCVRAFGVPSRFFHRSHLCLDTILRPN